MPCNNIFPEYNRLLGRLDLQLDAGINLIDVPDDIVLFDEPIIVLNIDPIPVLVLVPLLYFGLLGQVATPPQLLLHPICNLLAVINFLKGITLIFEVQIPMNKYAGHLRRIVQITTE